MVADGIRSCEKQACANRKLRFRHDMVSKQERDSHNNRKRTNVGFQE